MATNIDSTPIQTQRVRKTRQIILVYDDTGALVSVSALRTTTVQQSGADITDPIFKTFTVLAAQVPAAIAAQLAALYARIDTVDTAP